MSGGPIDIAGAQAAAAKAASGQSEEASRSLARRLQAAGKDEKKLKEACRDFESVFVGKLWQQMRDTLPKDGLLHSKQEDMYLSMFDNELAKKLSNDGGIGLGDMLYKQLTRKLSQVGRDAAPGGVEIRPLGAPDPATAQARGTSVDARPGLKSLDEVLRPFDPRPVPPASAASAQPPVEAPVAAQAPASSRDAAPAKAEPRKALGALDDAEISRRVDALAARLAVHDAAAPASSSSSSSAAVSSGVGEISPVSAAPAAAGAPVVADAPAAGGAGATSAASTTFGARPAGGLVAAKAQAAYGAAAKGPALPSGITWPVDGGEDASGDGPGIEIGLAAGQSVRACMDGTVRFAGLRDGRLVVEIESSGGTLGRYALDGESRVQAGDAVQAGREIAISGSKSGTGKNLLAFGLSHGGVTLDPRIHRERQRA